MVFINHIEVLDSQAAIVEIEGPLNNKTSPDFEEYINTLLKKNIKYILFDAKELEFVSSHGIGVILFLQKKISENNGYFVIYNIPSEIASLFNILGFDKIFKIAESRIDAMQIMDHQIELRTEGNVNTEIPHEEDEIEENNIDINSSENAGDEVDDFGESSEQTDNISDETKIADEEMLIDPSDSSDNHSDNYIKENSNEEDGEVTFDPFIVECANCKALIRVKKSGQYICPSCKEGFTVEKDMTIIFE